VTIENTDKNCAPLTNHLETLLCQMWAPSTCATLSRAVRKMINKYLAATSDNPGAGNFMLHDFGFRGVSSVEAAGIEGAGHLLNFLGTDTVKAMEVARDYYGAPINGIAYSVPATEHSVMTSLGREGEEKIVEQLLDTYPTGIVSIVSDSYDIYNFAGNILGTKFKDRILAREGKIVCRPDSGDPVGVTLKVLDILGEKFGYTINGKGYKVLNPKIGMLWGDGIDIDGIREILEAMMINRWSAENIVFGMGGGLLQKINRDTQRFAFKSSAQMRDGIWYDIFKDPLEGGKSSKRGRLALLKNIDGEFVTGRVGDLVGSVATTGSSRTDLSYIDDEDGYLETVFINGSIVKEYTFAEARANVLGGEQNQANG
jgi:nicotinamide phosphoribosyltransferase